MLIRDLQGMAVSEQDVSQVLYRLVLQKSIVVEEERIYSIRQYEEETQTASMIARRLLEKPVPLSIELELEKAQKTLGITLSETQKQAERKDYGSQGDSLYPSGVMQVRGTAYGSDRTCGKTYGGEYRL